MGLALVHFQKYWLLSKKVLEYATLATPEQARPARPRFGLDFQIHKVYDT
jgi:hypothetical protein